MTSQACIPGVLLLETANGTVPGGQDSVGIGAMSGMSSTTISGIFSISFLVVAVRRVFKSGPVAEEVRAFPPGE